MDNKLIVYFVGLVLFWSVIIVSTNVFTTFIDPVYYDIDGEGYFAEEERSWIEGVFTFADKIPVINKITPLLKIMAFSYKPDDVPYEFGVILWILSLLSLLVTYGLIRWGT